MKKLVFLILLFVFIPENRAASRTAMSYTTVPPHFIKADSYDECKGCPCDDTGCYRDAVIIPKEKLPVPDENKLKIPENSSASAWIKAVNATEEEIRNWKEDRSLPQFLINGHDKQVCLAYAEHYGFITGHKNTAGKISPYKWEINETVELDYDNDSKKERIQKETVMFGFSYKTGQDTDISKEIKELFELPIINPMLQPKLDFFHYKGKNYIDLRMKKLPLIGNESNMVMLKTPDTFLMKDNDSSLSTSVNSFNTICEFERLSYVNSIFLGLIDEGFFRSKQKASSRPFSYWDEATVSAFVETTAYDFATSKLSDYDLKNELETIKTNSLILGDSKGILLKKIKQRINEMLDVDIDAIAADAENKRKAIKPSKKLFDLLAANAPIEKIKDILDNGARTDAVINCCRTTFMYAEKFHKNPKVLELLRERNK